MLKIHESIMGQYWSSEAPKILPNQYFKQDNLERLVLLRTWLDVRGHGLANRSRYTTLMSA